MLKGIIHISFKVKTAIFVKMGETYSDQAFFDEFQSPSLTQESFQALAQNLAKAECLERSR
jgi:hypothetical protein